MTQYNKKILSLALICVTLGVNTVSAASVSSPAAPGSVSPDGSAPVRVEIVNNDPVSQSRLSRLWNFSKDYTVPTASAAIVLAATGFMIWSEIKMHSLKSRINKNKKLTRTTRLRLQAQIENLQFTRQLCGGVLVAAGLVFVGNVLHRWADSNPKLVGNDWYKRWIRNCLFAAEHEAQGGSAQGDNLDSDQDSVLGNQTPPVSNRDGATASFHSPRGRAGSQDNQRSPVDLGLDLGDLEPLVVVTGSGDAPAGDQPQTQVQQ